jgi:hypothetical protein
MTHEIRTTQIHVMPEGEPLFSERAFAVEIADDAGGEYVIVSGDPVSQLERGQIAINPDEWPALRRAIDKMVRGCRA